MNACAWPRLSSAWPTTADPLCGKRFVPFAAPVIVTPPPPSLEVSQGVDRAVDPETYFARLRVGCDGGARVSRVDLYRTRVADAAVPPIRFRATPTTRSCG